MIDPVPVVEALVEIVPEILEGKTYPRRCILATRLGIEALAATGYPLARPIPCRAMAASHCRLENESLVPTGTGEPYQLLVGFGSPPGATTVPVESKGYDGHLILGVGQLGVADLNLGQFARPVRGIVVPEAMWMPGQVVDEHSGITMVDDETNSLLVYMPHDNLEYRVANDWRFNWLEFIVPALAQLERRGFPVTWGRRFALR